MIDQKKLDEATATIRDMGLGLIVWVPEDIESVSKLRGDAAADWLEQNRKHIQDRSTERGWEVIDDLLDPDMRQDDGED
jgi:hypothetical protein